MNLASPRQHSRHQVFQRKRQKNIKEYAVSYSEKKLTGNKKTAASEDLLSELWTEPLHCKALTTVYLNFADFFITE
jgi:hypothetical protein